MNVNPTQETIELVSQAQKTPIPDDVVRAFTQPATATSGLIAYDLEAPSKKLYPILTPLRNRIARRADGYGIQSNWRAVTGINTAMLQIGVPEGQRGGVMAQATADYLAKFVSLGLENYLTFEADYASKNFEDLKALAVTQLLQATMIQEEFLDLGGNGTLGINGGSATPTPTVSDVTTGGTLAAATPYYVGCVALSLAGYQQIAAVNNGQVGQAISFANYTTGGNFLTSQYSITGADGQAIAFGGGVGRPSAIGTATTASDGNATHKIAATVAPVVGAVAYAWFFGAANAAASLYLTAVTTINSAVFSAAADSTAQPFSAITASDNSKNAYVYDGMLSQIMKTGSGAYFADLATGTPGTGTKLTSNGAGGIAEIDTAFASFWNNYRLSPDEIFVNAQQLIDMNTIIIANGGAPLYRFTMDANNLGTIEAGVVVGSILNVITNKHVKVTVHPNMPSGTIMFWSNSIPYPLNDVGSIVLKHLRRDYYQIEWPIKTRKYEYGVYFDGVLKNYFPPAFGIIRNIAPGH
jgi:hypothetical protein